MKEVVTTEYFDDDCRVVKRITREITNEDVCPQCSFIWSYKGMTIEQILDKLYEKGLLD